MSGAPHEYITILSETKCNHLSSKLMPGNRNTSPVPFLGKVLFIQDLVIPARSISQLRAQAELSVPGRKGIGFRLIAKLAGLSLLQTSVPGSSLIWHVQRRT
jgi:hypothetical protein